MSTPSLDVQNAMQIAQSAAIATPHAVKDATAAKKAATSFEGVFISQMLGTMFEGIPTDGPFDGGPGEEMFRSLMVDEYGKQMASQGGIGLSASIQRELLRMQEKAS
jgi:Rod binding domain-containing protein